MDISANISRSFVGKIKFLTNTMDIENCRICLLCRVTKNRKNPEINSTNPMEISVGFVGLFISNLWLPFLHSSFLFLRNPLRIRTATLLISSAACSKTSSNLLQNQGKLRYFSFYCFLKVIIVQDDYI